MRRTDSSRSVLNHQAVSGIQSQRLGAFKIGFGIGLSVDDVIGSNHHFRRRYPGELQARPGQVVSSRCDHAPTIRGERADEVDSSGHHDHSVPIPGLTVFQLASFLLGVKMGSYSSNHFDGSNTVRDRNHRVFVDSSLASPGSPLPIYGTCGVDENSIKIEKDRGTSNYSHPSFCITAMGSPRIRGKNLVVCGGTQSPDLTGLRRQNPHL